MNSRVSPQSTPVAAAASKVRTTGGADRHDTTPTVLDRAPRRRRDDVALRVHAVAAQVIHAHRLERAGPNVQRDPGYADPLPLQTAENRLVEVQPGG